MRNLLLALLAVLAAAASGCASARPAAAGGDEYGLPQDPMSATPHTYADDEPGFLANAGEAILSVPETILWWPVKVVGSAVRGGYDGVVDGVDRAPMPVVGVLVSPLTAAGGVVGGAFRGVGMGPAYVGSSKEFGANFSRPFTEPVHVWK